MELTQAEIQEYIYQYNLKQYNKDRVLAMLVAIQYNSKKKKNSRALKTDDIISKPERIKTPETKIRASKVIVSIEQMIKLGKVQVEK